MSCTIFLKVWYIEQLPAYKWQVRQKKNSIFFYEKIEIAEFAKSVDSD